MFDYSLYDYDQSNKERHEAVLRENACLYRVTSTIHCSATDILTGRGPMSSLEPGRFNAPQQQTTYCANNILVCFSEVLFHMYRLVLKRIQNKKYALTRAAMISERALVVIRVKEIKDLVYIDSAGVAVDYDHLVYGAAAVFPDPHYAVFQEFSNRVRQEKKRGIIYPSARHSRDVCMALFHDETNSILPGCHQIASVRFQLIPEDQNLDERPTAGGFDPYARKIHPTMGHYEVTDADTWEQLRDAKLLNPSGIPQVGMIDFVRRRYRVYPDQAVCSLAASGG